MRKVMWVVLLISLASGGYARNNPFREADVNRDGFISLEEFTEALHQKQRRKNKDLASERGIEKLFSSRDKNQDGRLSEQEYTSQPAAAGSDSERQKVSGPITVG